MPDGPAVFTQSELDAVESDFVSPHPTGGVLPLAHGLQQSGGPDDGVVVELDAPFRLVPGVDRGEVRHGPVRRRQMRGYVTHPLQRGEVGIEQAVQGQGPCGEDRQSDDGFQQGEARGHGRECGLWIAPR